MPWFMTTQSWATWPPHSWLLYRSVRWRKVWRTCWTFLLPGYIFVLKGCFEYWNIQGKHWNVQYREGWWDVLSVVFDRPIRSGHPRHKCTSWPDFYDSVVSELRPNLGMVWDIEKHIKSHESYCIDCHKIYAKRWSDKFADCITCVPKFMTFL